MHAAEIFVWMIMAIVKFVFTPSVMISAGKDWIETWIITSVGAGIGFIFFYYLGHMVFSYIHSHGKKKIKKISRSKIKMLRFIKTKGLRGLILIAPFISVPLAALIASRFFKDRKMIVPIFIADFCFWALIFTLLSKVIKNAF